MNSKAQTAGAKSAQSLAMQLGGLHSGSGDPLAASYSVPALDGVT